MFGGLEVKSGGDKDTEDAIQKNASDTGASSIPAPNGGMGGGSAFSFMKPSVDAPGIPSPPRSGGTNFIPSPTEGAKVDASLTTSGFRFISQTAQAPASAPEPAEGVVKEKSVDGTNGSSGGGVVDDVIPNGGNKLSVAGGVSSGFSFLAQQVSASETSEAGAPMHDEESAAATAPMQSSFTFLHGGLPTIASTDSEVNAPVAASTDTPAAAAAPAVEDQHSSAPESSSGMSGFSFISGGGAAPSAATPATDERERAESTGYLSDLSALSALSSTAVVPEQAKVLPEPPVKTPSSGLGVAATTAEGGSTGLVGGASSEPPTPGLSNTNTGFVPPAGTGVTFGGAAQPRRIQKKRRGRKIGVGGGAHAQPSSSMPPNLPEPNQQQPPSNPQQAKEAPKGWNGGGARAGGTCYNKTIQRQHSEDAASEDGSHHGMAGSISTKDAAEEATRKAEEFMREKMRGGTSFSASEDPVPSAASVATPPSPLKIGSYAAPPAAQSSPDETLKAAEAAAREARGVMEKEQRRSFGSGFMSGLFQRKSKGMGNNSNHGIQRSVSVGSNRSESPQPVPQQPSPDVSCRKQPHLPPEDKSYNTPSVSAEPLATAATSSYQPTTLECNGNESDLIACEQDERKAEEERHAKLREEKELLDKKAEEERLERIAAEEAEKKSPDEKLDRMLLEFSESTTVIAGSVSQLRKQRASLFEEKSNTEKNIRLMKQQIALTESQQAAAADVEDFDLADRLAAVLDKHTREKEEQEKVLGEFERALSELERQKDGLVRGVTTCFKDIWVKLEKFKEKQENTGKDEDTEAQIKFEATSKRISAESDRLAIDLKHLEQDEERAADERRELEQTIKEQTLDDEKLREEANSSLEKISEEIQALKKQLAEMESKALELTASVVAHDTAIERTRGKFSRQLNRISKKELSLQEHRSELVADKESLEALKENHEKDVQAHSQLLLKNDDLMRRLKGEISVAEQCETIIAEELDLGRAKELQRSSSELLQLQAELVEAQAAVDEAKEESVAAQNALENLQTELESIDTRIPILEVEKRAAVAKKNYKAAGKASKAIKEATLRKTVCKEEIEGTAKERVSSAEEAIQRLQSELDAKKIVAHEKEKEKASVEMKRLAEKIQKLEETKRRICGVDGEINGVASVGGAVLDEEISALKKEGESLGSKFGGWAELQGDSESTANEVVKEDDNENFVSADKASSSVTVDAADEENAVDEKSEKFVPIGRDDVSVDGESGQKEKATIREFRELTKRLREAEEVLEKAVAEEEYDKAAEVDDLMQELQAKKEALGLSDDEVELAMEDDFVTVSGSKEEESSGIEIDSTSEKKAGPTKEVKGEEDDPAEQAT